MATLMPSPLTGAHIKSHSWLARIGVGSKSHSQRLGLLPRLWAKAVVCRQLRVRLSSASKPNNIATMRHINTSVPLIGCIQLL